MPPLYLGRAAPAGPQRRSIVPAFAPYGATHVLDPDTAPSPWFAYSEKRAATPRAASDAEHASESLAPAGPARPAPQRIQLSPPAEDKRAPRRCCATSRRAEWRGALKDGCRFRLFDGGELSGGARHVILRLARRSAKLHGERLGLDPRVGDVISVGSGARKRCLDVQFVTRHKYFPPGRTITSCVVGVPDHQWRQLSA